MYTMHGKTQQTCHICFPRQSTYVQRTLPAGSPGMWQPFTSHQQSWAGPLLLRRRAPDTIHSTPLTNPHVHTQLLSRASQWSSGAKPSIYQWPTTRLTRPLSQVWDWYVQYLLVEANRTVLNWHRRGATTLEMLAFHVPLLDLPDQLSPHSPSGPARSPFKQVLTTRPKCWVLKNLWPPRGLSTTRPSTVANIYA
jgi:hypothetical protein